MKKTGFTLIEVLLALSIFSVLALCLYQTFSGTMLLNKKMRQVENFYGEIHDCLEIMGSELENVLPYRRDTSGKDGFVALGFAGEGDRIKFLVAAEDGLREVQYYLLTPDQETVHRVFIGERTTKNVAIVLKYQQAERLEWLVREERPFYPRLKDQKEVKGDVEILSRHVKAGTLHFKYAMQDDPAKPDVLSWRPDWDEGYFPAGVRMNISFWNPKERDEALAVEQDFFIPLGAWGGQGRQNFGSRRPEGGA
jgi:type II secretion system protein J